MQEHVGGLSKPSSRPEEGERERTRWLWGDPTEVLDTGMQWDK